MVTVQRLDDKQRLQFDNELEFREWYKTTMVASGNKLRCKIIRGKPPAKSQLDNRQNNWLGKGGEVRGLSNSNGFAKHTPRDTKAGKRVHRKLGYNRAQTA